MAQEPRGLPRVLTAPTEIIMALNDNDQDTRNARPATGTDYQGQERPGSERGAVLSWWSMLLMALFLMLVLGGFLLI
jgi:hypothetical protein